MDRGRLKIVAPLNLPEEVGPLIEAGADELYCGFLPQEWLAQFSLAVPINRRDAGPGNLRSFGQLGRIVDQAHAGGVAVYLTLNAQTYTEGQIGFLHDYCRRVAEEAGVDGWLVSDPALVRLLKEWLPETHVHASSLAAVHNRLAARFFGRLGAKRVILPRHVTVEEAAAIHRQAPEIELEIFVLNDGCVLEEGLCSTTHAAGAFCLTDWQYSFRRTDGGALSEAEREKIEAHRRGYRRWVLCHEASAAMTTETGFPLGPCGLCAVHAFYRAGAGALKVVGRESPTARKIASVRIVRAIRDLVIEGTVEDETIRKAWELRRSADACACGDYCYYPAVARRWAK